jgi:hypothetical protein
MSVDGLIFDCRWPLPENGLSTFLMKTRRKLSYMGFLFLENGLPLSVD